MWVRGQCQQPQTQKLSLSEAYSILGTGLNTPLALYAVWAHGNFVGLKLHRAHPLTGLTVYALVLIQLELIFAASKASLNCAHRAEAAPGPGSDRHSKENRDGCGDDTHGNKDHSHFIHQSLCDNYPEDHEPHERYEDRHSKPQAPEE